MRDVTAMRWAADMLDEVCGAEDLPVEDRIRGRRRTISPERKKQLLDLTNLPPSEMVRSIFAIYSATTGEQNEYAQRHHIEAHSGSMSHWALNGGIQPPLIVHDAVGDAMLCTADHLNISQRDLLKEAVRLFLTTVGDPCNVLPLIDMPDEEYERLQRPEGETSEPDITW